MASYFTLPPQEKAAAVPTDGIPEDARKQLGGMSLLSPQVTQILDDLEDDRSDSGSEEGSVSAHADSTHLDKNGKSPKSYQERPPNKAKISSLSLKKTHTKKQKGDDNLITPMHPTSGAKPKKPKPPRMARFHSLRSMLFSANIEDKMITATEEERLRETAAANKWKEQHEKRQMHRPKTPEKDVQGKEGIGSRLKTSLRRITSKDVPTMSQISEDKAATFDDNISTASSDLQDDYQDKTLKYKDDDEKSINHSDIDELVRWVSRRDVPSQGETEEIKVDKAIKEDSGHESFGHSDVDELVRWVSRRTDNQKIYEERLSEASTESDEEVAVVSSEDEDADDLVRWVSHREGPKAGLVRRKLQKGDLDWEEEQNYDSDVPELGRWATRQDDTSGESAPGTPVRGKFLEEPERGRSRSRSASPAIRNKTHLSSNDVDELVRWVSRKESKRQEPVQEEEDNEPVESNQSTRLEPETGDLRALRTNQAAADQAAVKDIQEKEDKKRALLGMTGDNRSLSHSDLHDVLTHVRTLDFSNSRQQAEDRNSPDANDQAELEDIQQKDQEKRAKLGMTSDNRSLSHSDLHEVPTHVKTLNWNNQQQPTSATLLSSQLTTAKDIGSPEPSDKAVVEEIKQKDDEKKEQIGMTVDDKSLTQSGLQEVLTHVKTLDPGKHKPHDSAHPASKDAPAEKVALVDTSDQTAVQEIYRKEDEKKAQLGMSVDEGSLTQGDLQEVITHAKILDVNPQQPHESSSLPTKDAPAENVVPAETSDKAVVHEIQKKEDEKKEQLGMSVDEGSLTHDGLQEVVTHVKSMNVDPQ